jgi:hypothetical protein
MQTFIQKDKLIFIGTIRELKSFLQTMGDRPMTLAEFISAKLH